MKAPGVASVLGAAVVASILLGSYGRVAAEEGAHSPESIVQKQVEAYNRRDLGAFIATYTDEAKVYRMPASEPATSGREQLRDFYRTSRFNLPKLHVDIVHRTVLGNKVIDHERVTGVREVPFEAVLVYSIVDAHIATVWMFTAD